jgi:ankyrin repeat protein
LIEHGAEVDAINLNGWTPLMYAAVGRSEDILRILIDSGADMSVRLPDETNRTAWDLVKKNSHLIDTIPWAMLLKGSIDDIDIRDENGLTPLLRAVEAENMELVRFLVESGSNINARNGNTRTPISVAVSGVNGTKLVEFLIDSGADVNSSDSARRTPLVWAIWTGSSVETVSLLIDNGANIESSNINGWTPLMYAVAGKKADTVQVILDRGSNVHATVSDGSGRTAWDIMQGNKYLRNTNAYWHLNDSRFP